MTPGRLGITLLLSAAAVPAACDTVKVQFMQTDGDSGGGGGEVPSGSGGVGAGGGTGGHGPDATAGAGGSLGGGFQGFGAAGGMGGYVGDLLVTASSAIRDVAATESHVYFIEYGTFDDLDNYRFDGALRRIEVESGDVETLVENLEGPLEVELTTAEAFVLLERSTTVSADGDRALGRIALTGGSFDLVPHDGPYDRAFSMAAFEDRAYFGVRIDDAWAIREYLPGESGRVILPFDAVTFPANQMAADEAHLYFLANGFSRQALTADIEPERLSSAAYTNFTLEGDRILATRAQAPMYLASMSKEGGAWSNVLRLGEHDSCKDLFVRGSRFFTECTPASGPSYVLTGPWAGGTQKGYKLAPSGAWSGTEDDLFIATDTELVRLSLD